MLKKLIKDIPHCKLYLHKKNVGRGGTVTEGILRAKAPIVGFIDIDLEVSPVYIGQFVDAIKTNQADVAIAQRFYPFIIFPFSNLLRIVLSKGYVFIQQFIMGIPAVDTEAGYKFFKRDKIMPILPKVTNTRWFWDTEIATYSQLNGLKVMYLPVLFLKKPQKTSTVRLVPDTIEFFASLLKLRKQLNAQSHKIPGLLYRFPRIYSKVMKLLFQNNYDARYTSIARLVQKGNSVLDVCCGDAKLAEYLAHKQVSYKGLDISLPFVKHNLKKNLLVQWGDVARDTLPSAEVVVMQGSLYQFKNPQKIINKLYQAAQQKVIISESVSNLVSNPLFRIPFVHKIATVIVGAYDESSTERYTKQSLQNVLKPYSPQYISIKGERDLIAVITKYSERRH